MQIPLWKSTLRERCHLHFLVTLKLLDVFMFFRLLSFCYWYLTLFKILISILVGLRVEILLRIVLCVEKRCATDPVGDYLALYDSLIMVLTALTWGIFNYVKHVNRVKHINREKQKEKFYPNFRFFPKIIVTYIMNWDQDFRKNEPNICTIFVWLFKIMQRLVMLIITKALARINKKYR